MINVPCMDCDNRQVGCHSHCCYYKEYKNTLKKVNKEKSDLIMANLHVLETRNRFSGRTIGER